MTQSEPAAMPTSVAETLALLDAGDYVADEALATVLFLAMRLGRPLLLEGEAGVGKTEIAKVLAKALGRRLIRLQCYEGLDQAQALYDWNYARQMLEIRLAEAAGEADGAGARERLSADLFSERFLLRRPLLDAITPDPAGPPVLLIDEIDRADEPFEAFLLELLADFQVTIPEIGTIRAETPPIVIVTSNRTREIHDALKRRCLYRWIDFPNEAREIAIVRRKTPAVAEAMAAQIVGFVQRLRSEDLFKAPGVAETLDWANALVQLDAVDLNPGLIDGSMGVLLKYQDDITRMTGAETARLLAEAQADIQKRASAGARAATA
ncbi:MoxR family ATPase [Tistrella sp. 25B02-3]